MGGFDLGWRGYTADIAVSAGVVWAKDTAL
jgi:hypothetical protein